MKITKNRRKKRFFARKENQNTAEMRDMEMFEYLIFFKDFSIAPWRDDDNVFGNGINWRNILIFLG